MSIIPSNKSLQLFNKGTKYLEKNNYIKAANFLKKSCKEEEFSENCLNLGTANKFLDRDTSAITYFTKAVKAPPLSKDTVERAYNNLGLMSYVVGLDEAAVHYYSKGLDLNPNYGDLHWNLGTTILRQACSGKPHLFSTGWNEYDWRFRKETSPITPKGRFGPLLHKTWNGEKNCRILVMAEQGLGDAIMFARFVPLVEKEYGCDVTVQMAPTLASAFPDMKTVEFDFKPEDYDYLIPLCSLASFFTVDTYTVEKYMKATDPIELEGINIGIVTSGSKGHANDRHRSCQAHKFKFLSKYGKLWNLNPGEKLSFTENPELNDFKDTANYAAAMDLVICVDTSTVHLCGALGVKTKLLQPYKETDFRWGDDTMGNKNIWYPSVEVYRNPMNWDFVFEQLREDLECGGV